MTMDNTSFDEPVYDRSGVNGESMATAQFKCVYMYTDGTMKIQTAGGAALGIMMDNNLSGQQCSYRVLGVFPALAASDLGTISGPMTALTPGADGGVKAASTGDVVIGYSLEPMLAAGAVHPILILPRMQAGTMPSGVSGDLPYYYSTTGWAALNKGTAGMQLVQGASYPAWSNTYGYTTLTFSFMLSNIAAAGHALVTNYVPGFACSIRKYSAVCTGIASGSDGSGQVVKISSTTGDVTNGTVTLTPTNMGTVGTVVNSTAITQDANSVLSITDGITITAAAGTAFTGTAGAVTFVIVLKPTTVVS
jgi:hypothetical protein